MCDEHSVAAPLFKPEDNHTEDNHVRPRHVDGYNFRHGGWGELYLYLFDDEQDPKKLIEGKDAREAGDALRERLLQDRAATSVVTALLLTISFAMLCIDPSQIKYAIVYDPNDRDSVIPHVSFHQTVEDAVSTTKTQDSEASAAHVWSIGLVRLAYVLLNVVSTMLCLISLYGGTAEYLLINKCPAKCMIYLVQHLHDETRSRSSKMFEPWKATCGAAAALMLSMVVLVFALYGPWIWLAAVLTVVGMSIAASDAFKHLAPDTTFNAVHSLHGRAGKALDEPPTALREQAETAPREQDKRDKASLQGRVAAVEEAVASMAKAVEAMANMAKQT
ncbi:unnamed protein product [Polarella glacialis]|nr:unnamed protein product [Polarella glacialis]